MPRFCLLGKDIAYSISPWLHKTIAQTAAYSLEYDLREMDPSELAAYPLSVLEDYDGLNITIPYKTAFNEVLVHSTKQAFCAGAANTIVVNHDDLTLSLLHNTDVTGAKVTLLRLMKSETDLSRSSLCILGTGGAARALVLAAYELSCRHLCLVTREHSEHSLQLVDQLANSFPEMDIVVYEYADLSHYDFSCPYIVVNATPCGTLAKVQNLPCAVSVLKHLFAHPLCQGAFDLVYNPVSTDFLQLAQDFELPVENGLPMLIVQALEAQKSWGLIDESHELYDVNWQRFLNIILPKAYNHLAIKPIRPVLITGYMGAGKSTLLKALAQEFQQADKKVFCFDLDEEITRTINMPISQYFEKFGESAFREFEAQKLQELLQYPNVIIATGGGTVIHDQSYYTMQQSHAHICYLDIEDTERAYERLSRSCEVVKHRPLLKDFAAYDRLYQQRLPYYQERSHTICSAWTPLEQLVQDIVSLIQSNAMDSH